MPLRRYFGVDATFTLRIVNDPDGEFPRRLFVFIETPLEAEAATEQLRTFDAEWFLYNLDRADGLNFEIDFR